MEKVQKDSDHEELAMLRDVASDWLREKALADRLGEALKMIEAHHAEKNDRLRKPQANNQTLSMVRTALADWRAARGGKQE